VTRRYAGVLLDVDGTLVDSNDAHAHCWVEALAAHDLEVPYAMVRGLIGMGGDLLIESVGGPERGTRANKQLGAQRSELFRETWLPKIRPLVGARALVLRLAAEGYHYAIASAAKAEELRPLLELAEVADLIEITTTSDDVEASKPAPDLVDAALARIPVERSRTVMLGDTEFDVQACRSAGVDIIGVTSGGWHAGALAGAIAVYRGPAELLAMWSSSPLA
jgi:phosphoglycolate phosphatase-like HAD superfamily hydrolase